MVSVYGNQVRNIVRFTIDASFEMAKKRSNENVQKGAKCIHGKLGLVTNVPVKQGAVMAISVDPVAGSKTLDERDRYFIDASVGCARAKTDLVCLPKNINSERNDTSVKWQIFV